MKITEVSVGMDRTIRPVPFESVKIHFSIKYNADQGETLDPVEYFNKGIATCSEEIIKKFNLTK